MGLLVPNGIASERGGPFPDGYYMGYVHGVCCAARKEEGGGCEAAPFGDTEAEKASPS